MLQEVTLMINDGKGSHVHYRKFLVAAISLDSDFSPTEITVVTLNYALFVITKCCQG